jgi:hypothetical protein
MSKPVKRKCPQCGQPKPFRAEIVQSSKRPSKVSVLADLLRVTEQAGTMEISRDYFRANSRFRDKWNMYWVSFKAFLAAGMADDDLYYEALVELVDEDATVTTSKASGE